MRTSIVLILSVLAFSLASCGNHKKTDSNELVIGSGQIPNLVTENGNNVHVVFGKGDSLYYSFSTDKGKSFSSPLLVDTLPGLVSFAMRGPQITNTSKGLAMIVATREGNIFSYIKDGTGPWQKAGRINDADTICKEGFLALGSDGNQNLFAAWLDLRNNAHNKIYGARSVDGGKTWSKNIEVYASPDGTVCECCKPSVAVKEKNIYVMFRNWIKGNRDLYLIQSSDGGDSFGEANKLGGGSWKLNGCPMDGGSVAINPLGIPQTVWRREGTIYACEPGKDEKEIGMGKSCTMTIAGKNNVYAWVEDGNIVCLLPGGKKELLGKGSLPVLKTIGEDELICVWQQDKEIRRALLHL